MALNIIKVKPDSNFNLLRLLPPPCIVVPAVLAFIHDLLQIPVKQYKEAFFGAEVVHRFQNI